MDCGRRGERVGTGELLLCADGSSPGSSCVCQCFRTLSIVLQTSDPASRVLCGVPMGIDCGGAVQKQILCLVFCHFLQLGVAPRTQLHC